MKLLKKKSLSYILVASMAMAALTGCSKDDKKTEDAVVEDNATVTEGAAEETTEEVTEEAAEETTEEATEEATEEDSEEVTEDVNSYTAYEQGFGGEIAVTVTLNEDGSVIESIDVNVETETPALGGAAGPEVAAAIVESQSLDVDTVSGATVTSNAVITAVNAILTVAGSDLAQ